MSINAARTLLKQGKTALFICDIQENVIKAMFEFDKIVHNSRKLIDIIKIFNVPMLVTEQNSKSLGKTIPELDISGAKCYEKMQLSMLIPEVRRELATMCSGERPEAIVLMGIETHACVESTAVDLRQNGYEVHTVADCCSSRSQEDRMLAFERMRDIGCHIVTSERILMNLMRSTEHEKFKEILKIVKKGSLYTGLAPVSKI